MFWPTLSPSISLLENVVAPVLAPVGAVRRIYKEKNYEKKGDRVYYHLASLTCVYCKDVEHHPRSLSNAEHAPTWI